MLVPAGYPHVGLDCFYIHRDLRLASGAEPSNSSLQPFFGLQLRWFSWHVPGWDPVNGICCGDPSENGHAAEHGGGPARTP